MKKLLIVSCCLAAFAVIGVIALTIIGSNPISPYASEGPLRLPKGDIKEVEIRYFADFDKQPFKQISTNNLAAQKLIAMVNHAPAHGYHFCGYVGSISLSYVDGQQVEFGYNPGHNSSEYEIVKTKVLSDGQVSIRCYSSVPRADFFELMRQFGIDDTTAPRVLPSSLHELIERQLKAKSTK